MSNYVDIVTITLVLFDICCVMYIKKAFWKIIRRLINKAIKVIND